MERNITIDILKGIGIILVVIGHAGCFRPINHVIYSFHMPLFFIASGFFFKETCIDNKMRYLIKKMQGLYFPYLKWSVLFLLLHNVFFSIGILNDTYGDYQGMRSHFYSISEILHRLFLIAFKMTNYEEFILGAYWFLRSLFVGCVLLCFVSWLFTKLSFSKSNSVLLTTLLFCLLGGAMTFLNVRIPYFPQGGYRELMGVFFLGCGYFIAKKIQFLTSPPLLIMCLILFITGNCIYPASMTYKATFSDWYVILLTGISGFILIYKLSQYLSRTWLGQHLSYVGRVSIYILTFHFLMFKPAMFVTALLYGMDWKTIGCHPVILPIVNDWIWIFNSAMSLCLSLFLAKIFSKCAFNNSAKQRLK